MNGKLDTSGLVPAWLNKPEAKPSTKPEPKTESSSATEPQNAGAEVDHHDADFEPPAPVLPDWLVKAEAERQQQEDELLARNVLKARKDAHRVNTRLRELGINPISAASERSGIFFPAKLTEAAYEAYAVHATWDEQAEMVRLLVEDWESPQHGFTGKLPSRLLHRTADVAYARHEGPTGHSSRRPSAATVRAKTRAVAIRGLNPEPGSNTSHDTNAVVAALGSLTAAVLYTAYNDQP
ncbi:hypothetical protein [Streptomyces cavernae]|uniref:hypothetical protein n=1 Tax=Streptomyces cavernae TaxID=2259034 RepID=UPI000FEB67AE|nr:hypothetical protein [Streptomyces cavernae]